MQISKTFKRKPRRWYYVVANSSCGYAQSKTELKAITDYYTARGLQVAVYKFKQVL